MTDSDTRLQPAIQRLVPPLTREMDLAQSHRLRGDTLEFMVRRDGTASTTITRHPDATITLRSDLIRPRNLPLIGSHITAAHDDHWAQVALQKLDGIPEADGLTSKERSIASYLAVNQAICDALGIEMNEEYSEPFFEDVGTLTDTGTMLRADRLGAIIMGSDWLDVGLEPWFCSVNQYNAVLRSEDIIRKVLAENQGITQLYWGLLLQLREEIPTPRTTGELADILRKNMALPPRAWKILLEAWAPGLIPEGAGHPEDTYDDDPRQYLDQAAAACRALAGANLTPICPELTDTILFEGELCHWFETNQWDHGNPFTAWSHIIRQGILAHQPDCEHSPDQCYTDAMKQDCSDHSWDVRTVGHSFRRAVETQQPWTQAGWQR